jgi:hypothetical protein
MTGFEDTSLDARLRDAAAAAAWPSTPDLRSAVVARIAREGLRPGHVRALPPARRPVLRLARAVAFAAVALLVVAGVAAALGFRLPGLDLWFVDRVPLAGTGLDVGSAIPLEEALAVERPRVLVPSALAPPDGAYLLGGDNGTIVTLAYRATDGQATLAGTDLALTVMAVRGDASEPLIGKALGPGTSLEPVLVAGSRGWWIAGAPHEILFLRPDGTVGVQPAAVAGDTLVFSREGTLYRLESALGRDATIAIAESMR